MEHVIQLLPLYKFYLWSGWRPLPEMHSFFNIEIRITPVHLCLFHIQVTTYNEDFKAERSDRERAQATIQEQKDEMVAIKQMVVVMVSELLN